MTGTLAAVIGVAIEIGIAAVFFIAGLVSSTRRRRSETTRLGIEVAKGRRFQSIIEHSPEMVVIATADHKVIWSSSPSRVLFGHRNMPNEPPALASLIHPDDLLALANLVDESNLAGVGGPAEVRVRHPDGTWRTVEMTVTDLRDVDEVGGYVWRSRDVTNDRRVEEVNTLATLEDPLTHVANRILFTDRLSQALRRARGPGGYVAVLLGGLDRFEQVNEIYGHAAGDAVLRGLAERLQACVRPEDTLARLGSDVFAILLEDIADLASAEAVASAMVDLARQPLEVSGSEIRLGVSVGIAISRGVNDSASDLLRNAATAMRAAKTAGRGGVAAFGPASHARVEPQLLMAAELEVALDRRQFEVHYQPTYSLITAKIEGAEALVRWRHPSQGLLLPGKFIPVAEQSSQIVRLGQWVMARACADAARWQLRHPVEPARYVSVNVSARQLAHPDIILVVRQALAESGLDPHSLVLEITESVLMDDVATASARLGSLHDLGVRLAIDDFGTGYSSLAYLRHFPVDILKIDRMFTEAIGSGEPRAEALVHAIIEMAWGLNLSTIAEGIESEVQQSRLRSMGCETGQGFLFAEPMSAESLEARLARGW